MSYELFNVGFGLVITIGAIYGVKYATNKIILKWIETGKDLDEVIDIDFDD